MYEALVARGERCAALERLLGEDPKNKDLRAEFKKTRLSEAEKRHVSMVRNIRRVRKRIEIAHARAVKDENLQDRIDALEARLDDMDEDDKGYERFEAKLEKLKERLADVGRHGNVIPVLERRLAELCDSDALLTKEDING